MGNRSNKERNMNTLSSIAWKSIARSVAISGVCCVLFLSLAWSIASPTAIASPLPPVLASTPDAIKDLANEVEDSVDDLSGARIGERDGTGAIERPLDIDKTDTSKQIESWAKRELERSQSPSTDIRTEIQNAADDLSDRVKGAFN
jgi:hypothetical protein